MRRKLVTFLIYCTFVLIIGAALFYLWYRPWALTWGATRDEVTSVMPGDDLVRQPTFNATRAVSIRARPEQVWPWIVQMGYKRAGFYSYDRLDNAGIPSAERILPQYQGLKVGDPLPMGAKDTAKVLALQPNELLLLTFPAPGGGKWTWTWSLRPEPQNGTRLITRLRADEKRIVARFLMDAVEIVMMRKCLLGIKRRAESH